MLYGSNIKIPSDLSGAISGVGSPGYNAYNAIGSNYTKAKNQIATDATARGLKPSSNSYGTDRLKTAQGLDVGNLESSISGGLGDTSYQNTKDERDYGQKMQIAKMIADANKPSLLEQIMQGVGSVGGPLAMYYGMKGKKNTSGMEYGGGNPSYDIMNPGPLDLGYSWGGR